MKILLNNILKQFKEIQQGNCWIGENFHKKLKQITPETAFAKPLPNIHSVAEIISHLTVWREESILKIKTGKGSITDDLDDNWFNNSYLKTIGWHQILTNYTNSLTELIDLLKTKDDSFLQEIYYDTDYKNNYPYAFLIEGMLHHDIYHLGQIGIILKLLKENKTHS